MKELKESMLYEKLEDKKVKCNICGRRCFIPSGSLGFCRVKKNEDGILISMNYGILCSAIVDPIEKKPLSHFHPGSSVLSIATIGCNFRCKFCDNWVISQETKISGRYIEPEEIVKLAKEHDCQGISYTYTEPAIFFEYAYDTAKIAHEQGLFNTFVTNGYLTPEAIKTIAPFLDAATVDFKGGGDPSFYKTISAVPDVNPIYECLLEMKRNGIHIEITNLVIPKYGDSLNRVKELAIWIKENLGVDTPFHLLRFHPDYQLTDVPSTPIKTLERACEEAMKVGLNYVYIGNVPGHKYENTYCPNCKELLVERFGFEINRWRLKEGNICPRCDFNIAIKGSFKPRSGLCHYSVI
ncbi:MAG: AmmeMemoRadiSam system radical SAM enzyme [Candidatus Bathyarchaeia archaeon]